MTSKQAVAIMTLTNAIASFSKKIKAEDLRGYAATRALALELLKEGVFDQKMIEQVMGEKYAGELVAEVRRIIIDKPHLANNIFLRTAEYGDVIAFPEYSKVSLKLDGRIVELEGTVKEEFGAETKFVVLEVDRTGGYECTEGLTPRKETVTASMLDTEGYPSDNLIVYEQAKEDQQYFQPSVYLVGRVRRKADLVPPMQVCTSALTVGDLITSEEFTNERFYPAGMGNAEDYNRAKTTFEIIGIQDGGGYADPEKKWVEQCTLITAIRFDPFSSIADDRVVFERRDVDSSIYINQVNKVGRVEISYGAEW